jgi:hypothetical protein
MSEQNDQIWQDCSLRHIIAPIVFSQLTARVNRYLSSFSPPQPAVQPWKHAGQYSPWNMSFATLYINSAFLPKKKHVHTSRTRICTPLPLKQEAKGINENVHLKERKT